MLCNIALITVFALVIGGIYSQNGEVTEDKKLNYANLMRKYSLGNLNRYTTDCYSSLMKINDRKTEIYCSAGNRLTDIISIGVVAH